MSAKPNIPRPFCSFPVSAPTLAYCFTSITLSREHWFLIAVLHGLQASLPILRLAALVDFSYPVMLNLSMSADSCSCAFAYLCRHCLHCPVRHCLYCHTLHSPHFYFAKVAKPVPCKYHSSFIISALFSKSFGTSLKTFALPSR